jgi:hypothetical protein
VKIIGKIIAVVLAGGFIAGSSSGNIFKGPDDYYRNHHAQSFADSIDRSIEQEANREPPNGYRTKPYSPEQWQDYWNRRIFHILSSELPESYKGPSDKEFVVYIISERKKHDLPEITFDVRTKRLIEQFGRGNK